MRQYKIWFPPKVLLNLGFESTSTARRLIWVLPLLLLIACKTSAQGDGEYTDTVYPEVWDWQPEQYKMDRISSMSFYSLADGDVLINFTWADEVDGEQEYYVEYFTFFGGQKFTSQEEAFITLEGTYNAREAADRLVSIFGTKLLPNGKEIDTRIGFSSCDRRFDTYLSIYDLASSQYLIDKRTLLFLPHSPFNYPNVRCEWGTDPSFTHDVVILNPANVIPLRDNTFLVFTGGLGPIIRFDENLESYSALIGTSLFAVDHEDLREFIQKFPNSDDPLRLRNAWGYGLNYPVILDELEQMIKQVVSRSEWLLEAFREVE